jgi:hypothetical protein
MHTFKLASLAAAFAFSLALLVGCSTAPEESFATPELAADSLISALRTDDQPRLHKILGPDYQDLLYSGDDVADKQAIQHVIQGYDQKHIIVRRSDQPGDQSSESTFIAIGNDAWPIAIPIVKNPKTNTWYFSTQAGRDELLTRRIGFNELQTIQVCLAIVDAQREYAARDPQKAGRPNYATRLVSSPGKKDGLYWPASSDGLVTKNHPTSLSPLGSLIAKASESGYTLGKGPVPYNGYYYRMLTSQAIPNHPDRGVVEYVQSPNCVVGFAVVAYPAKYGNSGIMSFIVNQRGVVYQKDLGPDTNSIAKDMTTYNPADAWEKVEPDSKK